MKKYLIVNDDGTKKTIYAKDLMQVLKLGDAINIIPGMFITLKMDPLHSVYRVKEINHGEYGVVLVRYSIWDGQLVERDAGCSYSLDSLKKNVTNIFNTYDEAKKYLLHHDAVRAATNHAAYITGLKSLRKKNDSVDAAPGVDKKKFDRLVNYFNAWGKPSRNELQEVIDYYKLNSATAYQLLYYWGYKNEFEKLHFYDSRIKDAYEVLWYTDKELNYYETKEFRSRAEAMNFYNAHKNDKDKFAWWVTRRNSDWAVVEDIVY